MDEQTALVLALQLVALFSIAGALLLYLLCKINPGPNPAQSEGTPGGGKPVLVTSCDTAIGLQIAMHLANRGFRVFAGLREGAASGTTNDSVAARTIRTWQKYRESLSLGAQGTIVALPLDVNREDLLHEAVDIIRAHLPAGEDGIWAVINTSGLLYRGRLDQQDISHWDAMLKTNVIGVLRTARTFQGLLRNTGGRLITLGADDGGDTGLVAYTAARYAVNGASNALRQELGPLGIKIVTLNPKGISSDLIFSVPRIEKNQEGEEVSVDISGCPEYQPQVLSSAALETMEIALTCREPKCSYTLLEKKNWSQHLRMYNLKQHS